MRGVTFFSSLSGVTSLILGLGTSLALLSYVGGGPIGPGLFERVTADVPNPSSPGGIGGTLRVEKLIPSMKLVGILLAGAGIGGLGTTLAQGRLPKKRRRIIRLTKVGLISNVVGILLWWLAILLTDWTQYD